MSTITSTTTNPLSTFIKTNYGTSLEDCVDLSLLPEETRQMINCTAATDHICIVWSTVDALNRTIQAIDSWWTHHPNFGVMETNHSGVCFQRDVDPGVKPVDIDGLEALQKRLEQLA